jgi:ribosome-associated translation inhibitor RaiA
MTGVTRARDARKVRQRRERRHTFAESVGKSRKRDLGRTTTRETPLDIQTGSLELDSTLRAYIRQHAGFKLGKFALQVTHISIRFEIAAGAKAGSSSVCRFRVVLPGRRAIVVTARDTTPRSAFDAAAEKIERAVRRRLDRMRVTRRQHRILRVADQALPIRH